LRNKHVDARADESQGSVSFREMIPGDRGMIGFGWWVRSPCAPYRMRGVWASFTSSSGGRRRPPNATEGLCGKGRLDTVPSRVRVSSWFRARNSRSHPPGAKAATASQHGQVDPASAFITRAAEKRRKASQKGRLIRGAGRHGRVSASKLSAMPKTPLNCEVKAA